MTQSIRSIIVEDEKSSTLTLMRLLEKYCPEVEVIFTATTVKDAISKIDKTNPDLIFLDIGLPDGDGFNVLNEVRSESFEVIFTTAYDHYAIKAFEFSAIHFLLKPIDYKDLQVAVKRFINHQSKTELSKKFQILKEHLNNKPESIILPSADGLEIYKIDEIVRCEANDNYTSFHLANKKIIVMSRSLNNYETMLENLNFARIHQKHLINIKYIRKINKGKYWTLTMSDNAELQIAAKRKHEFIAKLTSGAVVA